MKNVELIKYWIESSDKDYQAMIHLFEKGDYSWSLFIGHLVIEKLLKALFVQEKLQSPPFIHDLSRLAAKCDLELDEKQKDVLDALTTFNIRGRYDDFKMEFYHRCTEGFTENWLKSIKEFRTWLKENHLKRC